MSAKESETESEKYPYKTYLNILHGPLGDY